MCSIIIIKRGSDKLRPRDRFLVYVHCDLGLGDPWVTDNNCVKYYPDPKSQ